ncbi:mannose-6-phosphate isomerase-like protein (cupin superfamily) [Rhodoligotrophos appendicifer]|uniref:cupin domain-containing protein n=1 Tax=Rhodoligotrophos appendicifer TaxID=987056 RepID=UPI00117C76C3|nr:cupin domain-containing protein [Rhodoligotrophos appendicifer]
MMHRKALDGFRWDGIDHLPYKEEGSVPFKDISRQVLLSAPELSGELRYFEMGPEGFSTLERHEHMHGVMIFRGEGHCLVGDEVRFVRERDLVTIPPWTWHQFRATAGVAFGFLCMVNTQRDKPQLPSDTELEELRTNPTVRAFLDGEI